MESLYIENFKNIKKLQLDNLRRVNMIVGKNNVGKSTLLEAISLYLNQGTPAYLQKLLERRGELQPHQDETEEERKEHFLSLFNDYGENYSKSNYVYIGNNITDTYGVKIYQVYIRERAEKDEEGLEHRIRSRLFEEDLSDATEGLLDQDEQV